MYVEYGTCVLADSAIKWQLSIKKNILLEKKGDP